MWLVLAFLAPAFYAVAEVYDNFLSNKEFTHPISLVFYSSVFNLLFVPVLFYFYPPAMPPVDTWYLFILLGIVGAGYLYPYYKALKTDDTSIVVSFFAIERLFVPILAFFVVGEVLAPQQYIGLGLVVFSVIALGLHHARAKFRFSKALGYIGFAAFLLAFEGIFLKLLFEKGVTVSTAVGGEALMTFILVMALLLFKSARRNIRASYPIFKSVALIFLLEELFTFIGQTTESGAIASASVSVVKGITMTSPFFLLIYAGVGYKFFPDFFKENLHRKQVLHKLFLFAILIAGILLLRD